MVGHRPGSELNWFSQNLWKQLGDESSTRFAVGLGVVPTRPESGGLVDSGRRLGVLVWVGLFRLGLVSLLVWGGSVQFGACVSDGLGGSVVGQLGMRCVGCGEPGPTSGSATEAGAWSVAGVMGVEQLENCDVVQDEGSLGGLRVRSAVGVSHGSFRELEIGARGLDSFSPNVGMGVQEVVSRIIHVSDDSIGGGEVSMSAHNLGSTCGGFNSIHPSICCVRCVFSRFNCNIV
ncbi:unnamed protein product [Lupinus luteus]|uniref:Uncharacterized protein n=1 Tax=Lupinus luteus TaxID=3873 RepID=A0AAV1XEA4_LUPLU